MFSFKLFAVLGCFHVQVCDDQHSIADIRVQGMSYGSQQSEWVHRDADTPPNDPCPAGIDASVLVQPKETEVFTRIRDIVVTDVDPKTIHRKVWNLYLLFT